MYGVTSDPATLTLGCCNLDPVPISTFESLEIRENVPLAPYTTFQIGGPARRFCTVTSETALQVALRIAQENEWCPFILGGGSNLLVADSGFDGLVIHIAIDGPIRTALQAEELLVYAPSGLDWNAFVLQMCEQGISGVECLAGIPGLVGGSPIQNIGAYGQEVAETIHQVSAYDLETRSFVELSHADCAFAYRTSIFNSTQRNRYVVTSVTFRFDRNAKPNLTYADLKNHFAASTNPPTPLDVYHAVRAIRHGKGMLLVEGEQDCRSAGSFFKNPIVPSATLAAIASTLNLAGETVPRWPTTPGYTKLPAAWLLHQAGFHKGFILGNAGISSRHTLALINRGNASATDIVTLRDLIQREVADLFKINLQQEPVLLGF